MQHTAYDFSLTWSILSHIYCYGVREGGWKVVICFWSIPGVYRRNLTLLLFTSFRVDCTKFLDQTGCRRIFWKCLGHKQTSRPCLSWLHLPRIAQNLTQSLVKSYMVPYNKQTKVHTLVSLTSWSVTLLLYLLLQTCPAMTLPTSSPYSNHTSTLIVTQRSAQVILSFRNCPSILQLPVKEPHRLQNSTQKEPLP